MESGETGRVKNTAEVRDDVGFANSPLAVETATADVGERWGVCPLRQAVARGQTPGPVMGGAGPLGTLKEKTRTQLPAAPAGPTEWWPVPPPCSAIPGPHPGLRDAAGVPAADLPTHAALEPPAHPGFHRRRRLRQRQPCSGRGLSGGRVNPLSQSPQGLAPYRAPCNHSRPLSPSTSQPSLPFHATWLGR